MTDESPIDVEAFKRFEREGYSRVAQDYDKATAIVTSQANDALLEAVGTRRGTALLDVACGPGWLCAAAVKRGAIVTAVDFAENMVAIARLRCPQADVHNGDAERLPFENSQFDAVVCSLGLLHLPDPERAVGEAFPRAQGRWSLCLHVLDAPSAQSVLRPHPRIDPAARKPRCEPTGGPAPVSVRRVDRV